MSLQATETAPSSVISGGHKTPALFTNLQVERSNTLVGDALRGRIAHSFASHYMPSQDSEGHLVLELYDEDAGLVMTPPKGEYRAWLKSEFQKLAKADVAPELMAQAIKDFHVDDETDMRRMRTVGCGTNVVFVLNDGVYYASVERTAPSKTDSGAPNPGAYSCAAGGSTGDIDQTGFRELNEELFIVARGFGHGHTAFYIAPEAYDVADASKRAIFEERKIRYPQILEAHGRSDIQLTNHFELVTPCLSVEGLTSTVIERTQFRDKTLTPRVQGDAPHQMDLNVHGLTYIRLPISRADVVGVYDGEMNQKGELLRRKWDLYRYEDIHGRFARKEINMSLVPGKVVMAKDLMIAAIDRDLGL